MYNLLFHVEHNHAGWRISMKFNVIPPALVNNL